MNATKEPIPEELHQQLVKKDCFIFSKCSEVLQKLQWDVLIY